MTRVTNAQIQKLALNSLNNTRAHLQKRQEVAMSGKRVVLPSDDPTAAARARLLEGMRARAEGHKTNISYGMARLQTAEQSLAEAGNQISRLKEIALAMANGTLNGRDREIASHEVEAVRGTMIEIINTQHLGEYVFAHVDTGSPPYDAATEAFTYDVDLFDGVRSVEVGPERRAEIGSSGSHAFASRAADPSSVDLPAMIAQLRDALQNDDVAAVRATIDGLDAAYDQVVRERAQTGIRMSRLSDAEKAAEQSDTVFTQLRGELVDADVTEAFSELSLAQTTMQAAVTVAARIMGPSLLDVL